MVQCKIRACRKLTDLLRRVGLPLVIVLSLAGCDGPLLLDPSGYAVASYDGDLQWSMVDGTAPWGRRQDAAAVVHDGKLWIIGGYDPTARGKTSTGKDDVWKTSDGLQWELVLQTAPFKALRGHTATSHNGTLFVIGGFEVDPATGTRRYSNDVWRSTDGEAWTRVAPGGDPQAAHPWRARMYHRVLSTGSALYLMGGFYNGAHYLDDLWVSYDEGATWEELLHPTLNTPITLPGARASFASTVDASGKLYVQGGAYEDAIPSHIGSADPSVPGWPNLWVFDPAKPESGWKIALKTRLRSMASRRSDHAMEILDGNIWLLPGKANSSYRFSSDPGTYSTEVYVPGTGWQTDSLGSGPGPRYGYASAVWEPPTGPMSALGKRIWLLGGMTDHGATGEVWHGRIP